MSRMGLFTLLKDRRLARSRLREIPVLQACAAWYFLARNMLTSFEGHFRQHTNRIADDAVIHPAAIISSKNVCIGPRSCIGPGVVIHDHVTIGEDCTVRENAVLGSPGFEYRRLAGRVIPIAQAGGVTIGAGSTIGSLSVIDRAVLKGEVTSVGAGVWIGSAVHLAHNASVADGCRIGNGAMISGHTQIGPMTRIGTRAMLADGLTIGRNVEIGPGTVVTHDVGEGRIHARRPVDNEIARERSVVRDLPLSAVMEWSQHAIIGPE